MQKFAKKEYTCPPLAVKVYMMKLTTTTEEEK